MIMLQRVILPGLLLAGLSAVAAEDPDAVAQRFIGDYELIAFVQFPENSAPVSRDYTGRIRYDEFGNMAAIGMPPELPRLAAQSGERVFGGFAYWGSISIDTEKQMVVHHVQGSPTAPQWVGGDNVRYYEFEEGGDILKLSLRNESGRTTATLTWRRLK